MKNQRVKIDYKNKELYEDFDRYCEMVNIYNHLVDFIDDKIDQDAISWDGEDLRSVELVENSIFLTDSKSKIYKIEFNFQKDRCWDEGMIINFEYNKKTAKSKYVENYAELDAEEAVDVIVEEIIHYNLDKQKLGPEKEEKKVNKNTQNTGGQK